MATDDEAIYDNLIDVIRRRRSVRKFEKGRSVSKETLNKIAEAGRWAPSGANVQPWDFIRCFLSISSST